MGIENNNSESADVNQQQSSIRQQRNNLVSSYTQFFNETFSDNHGNNINNSPPVYSYGSAYDEISPNVNDPFWSVVYKDNMQSYPEYHDFISFDVERQKY